MTHAEAATLEGRVQRDMKRDHKALFYPFVPEGYTEYHTASDFYHAAVRHGLMTEAECVALQQYQGERWWLSNIE